jgi:hypothetical protein
MPTGRASGFPQAKRKLEAFLRMVTKLKLGNQRMQDSIIAGLIPLMSSIELVLR